MLIGETDFRFGCEEALKRPPALHCLNSQLEMLRRRLRRPYWHSMLNFAGPSRARAGAAVDQRAAGLTTGEIAQAGGWKGEAMPARYTAHLSVNESAAAKLARLQGRE